jgi:hypothetical protein
MLVDVDEQTVILYQGQRLKEKAATKTINEEVGFLLRLIGERGEPPPGAFAKTEDTEITREQAGSEGIFAGRKAATHDSRSEQGSAGLGFGCGRQGKGAAAVENGKRIHTHPYSSPASD